MAPVIDIGVFAHHSPGLRHSQAPPPGAIPGFFHIQHHIRRDAGVVWLGNNID